MQKTKLKNILLVDSDSNKQAMYKLMITKNIQCNLLNARGEFEAKKLLNNNDFDLVIIGASLPYQFSIGLVDYLKKSKKFNKTPIFLLVNSLNPTELQNFVSLRVDDILLVVNFNVSTFIGKIKGLLSGQKTSSLKPMVKNKQVATSPNNVKQVKLNPKEEILQKIGKVVPDGFIEQKLTRLASLNPFPFIITDLSSISEIDFNKEDLIKLITSDTNITTKIIKLINSSFYRHLGVRITDVASGIKQLGFEEVKQLAIVVAYLNHFMEDDANKTDEMNYFWYHSLCVSITAREIALYCKVEISEMLMLTGIIQNLGYDILKKNFPSEIQKVEQISFEHSIPLSETEHKMLGLLHNQVSTTLLTHWNLPKSAIIPVAFTHLTFEKIIQIEEKYSAFRQSILILKLADTIVKSFLGGLLDSEEIIEIPEQIMFSNLIKATKTQLSDLGLKARYIAEELSEILLPHISYEEIESYYKFNKKQFKLPPKCLIVHEDFNTINLLENIFTQARYNVAMRTNNISEDKILYKEAPELFIVDISDITKKFNIPENLIKTFNKAREELHCQFVIIASPQNILKYQAEMENPFPPDIHFLPKPLIIKDVTNFIDKMFEILEK